MFKVGSKKRHAGKALSLMAGSFLLCIVCSCFVWADDPIPKEQPADTSKMEETRKAEYRKIIHLSVERGSLEYCVLFKKERDVLWTDAEERELQSRFDRLSKQLVTSIEKYIKDYSHLLPDEAGLYTFTFRAYEGAALASLAAQREIAEDPKQKCKPHL